MRKSRIVVYNLFTHLSLTIRKLGGYFVEYIINLSIVNTFFRPYIDIKLDNSAKCIAN